MSKISKTLTGKLKERTKASATRQGKTPHASMVETIEKSTRVGEARERFIAQAAEADKDMMRSGKAYAAEDVHAYLRELIAGRKASRPKAINWKR